MSIYFLFLMDLGLVAAVVMLAVWFYGTFFGEAPGWLHSLLTVGVFLAILRIVKLKSSRAPTKR